jgi:hypothetical protein
MTVTVMATVVGVTQDGRDNVGLPTMAEAVEVSVAAVTVRSVSVMFAHMGVECVMIDAIGEVVVTHSVTVISTVVATTMISV